MTTKEYMQKIWERDGAVCVVEKDLTGIIFDIQGR
jgi:hypothetical protein